MATEDVVFDEEKEEIGTNFNIVCAYCQEKGFTPQTIHRHQNVCYTYSLHYKEIDYGYGFFLCNHCPLQTSERTKMVFHICSAHPKVLKDEQNQEVTKNEDEEQKTLTTWTCNICKNVFQTFCGFSSHGASCKMFFGHYEKIENGYKCKFCNLQLATMQSIYEHIRKKHMIDGVIKEGEQYFSERSSKDIEVDPKEPSKRDDVISAKSEFQKKERILKILFEDSEEDEKENQENEKSDLNAEKETKKEGETLIMKSKKHERNGTLTFTKCLICSEMIQTLSFQRHVRNCKAYFQLYEKVDEKKFLCKSCSKIFANRGKVYDHIRTKHPTVKEDQQLQYSKCNLCQEQFLSSIFTKHKKKCQIYFKYCKILKDGHFQCNLCPSREEERLLMFKHVRENHMFDKKLKRVSSRKGCLKKNCSFCNKSVDASYHEKHENSCSLNTKDIVSINNGFQCKICDNVYKSKTFVYLHINKRHPYSRSRKNSKPKESQKEVEKQTEEKTKLNSKPRGRPKKREKEIEEKDIQCHICDATFDSSEEAIIHVQKHLDMLEEEDSINNEVEIKTEILDLEENSQPVDVPRNEETVEEENERFPLGHDNGTLFTCLLCQDGFLVKSKSAISDHISHFHSVTSQDHFILTYLYKAVQIN